MSMHTACVASCPLQFVFYFVLLRLRHYFVADVCVCVYIIRIYNIYIYIQSDLYVCTYSKSMSGWTKMDLGSFVVLQVSAVFSWFNNNFNGWFLDCYPKELCHCTSLTCAWSHWGERQDFIYISMEKYSRFVINLQILVRTLHTCIYLYAHVIT